MKQKCTEVLTFLKKHKLTVILFLVTFIAFLIWLASRGSMVDSSGDAQDIWKTITSYYSGDIYPSYVLYKGFVSVYPYVWLYQLAVLFGTNEFFFVMVYHALLFTYITVVGLPNFIKYLFDYEPKWWQRILIIPLLYLIWVKTGALSQLMVDLPSCAIFMLAINSAIKIENKTGIKRVLSSLYLGFIACLGASVSGQYSVAMGCVIIFVLVKLIPLKVLKDKTKRGSALLCVLLLIVGAAIVKLLGYWFDSTVIKSFEEQGVTFLSGQFWLNRGLLYMMDKSRLFYGPTIVSQRGFEIVAKHYGGVEQAKAAIETAGMGGSTWSVFEYLKMVLHYPFDYICLYVDKFFACISIDFQRNSIAGLTLSYTAIYLALYSAMRYTKKAKNFFNARFWLVIGCLLTVLPNLALCVEMRCEISLHCLLFGTAILGPALPDIFGEFAAGIKLWHKEKTIKCLGEKKFPWGLVFYVIFVLICIAHYGAMLAQSGLGENTLFNLF